MTDERANLPSASAFDQVAFCPGSRNMLNSLPPEVRDSLDEPDEQALRGQRIHKGWETDDRSELSEDEAADLEKTELIAQDMANKWLQDMPAPKPFGKEYKEQRLWYHDSKLNPIASGQPDFVHINGESALVLDLKSGWCRTLSGAEVSWQLRLLAVLVRHEYGVKHVRAAFIKPKFFNQATDVVDYSESDLNQAEQMFLRAIWKAKQPDAQRIPGSWCRWCKAKAYCREAASYAMLPATITTNGAIGFADQLTVEQVCEFVKKKSIITKITDSIYKRAKTFDDAILSAHGLQRSSPKNLDPITKVPKAFQKIYSAITAMPGNADSNRKTQIQAALWAAMKMGKGDLVDSVRGLTGKGKKETEEWLFKDLLVDCMEKKQSEPGIEEA